MSGIKSDRWIKMQAAAGMIKNFVDKQVRVDERGNKILSYGVTSYGYDVRIAADGLKLFSDINGVEIDPAALDPDAYVAPRVETLEDGRQFVRIPPHGYLLGRTVEGWDIPRDILIICLGKSTYARAGVSVNVTPIEPEFEGVVVLEIANHTPLPVRIYLNQGIAQFVFLQSDEDDVCEVSYKDKGGKYQNQVGVQDAIV